jgi:hypothetical protein
MPVTKLKGIIDQQGKLIIEEKINLNPGKVEVVILQIDDSADRKKEAKSHPIKYRSQTFKDLLETESPVDADFDVEQLKSKYFQEKYNL